MHLLDKLLYEQLFLCNTQSSNSLCTQPPEAFINNNSNSNSSSSSRLKTESEYLMHLHNLSCYACCKISQKQTKKKETNIPTAVKSAAITYLKRFSPKTVSIRVMRVRKAWFYCFINTHFIYSSMFLPIRRIAAFCRTDCLAIGYKMLSIMFFKNMMKNSIKTLFIATPN